MSLRLTCFDSMIVSGNWRKGTIVQEAGSSRGSKKWKVRHPRPALTDNQILLLTG